MHAQRLTGLEVVHDHLAVELDPGVRAPGELLQDESLAAEDAGTEPLLEPHRQLDSRCAAEEAVPLGEEPRALPHLDRQDLSGELGGEGDHAGGSLGQVFGHEDPAAGDAELQHPHHAPGAGGLGGGLQLDGLRHPGQLAGLRHESLARLKRHLQHRHGGALHLRLHR
jgi:hypothetical protein